MLISLSMICTKWHSYLEGSWISLDTSSVSLIVLDQRIPNREIKAATKRRQMKVDRHRFKNDKIEIALPFFVHSIHESNVTSSVVKKENFRDTNIGLLVPKRNLFWMVYKPYKRIRLLTLTFGHSLKQNNIFYNSTRRLVFFRKGDFINIKGRLVLQVYIF